MGKKFRIVLAIFFVACLGVLIWQAQRQQEPVYHGKPLSFWLEGYDIGNYNHTHPKGPSPPTYDEANDAIRQIGTNAIPNLLRMLQQPDSKLKTTIIGLLEKQHLIKSPFGYASRNFKAYHSFVVLGSRASNAVPRLIEIFDRDHSAFCQQAVPAILGHIGPAASQATPTLLWGMTHTNGIVRGNSIFALRQIYPDPKLVLPALIRSLNDPETRVRAQAVCSLGALGEDAQAAVPTLLELWRKEPQSPPRNLIMSLDGGIVSSSWGTNAFPFNAPDVVSLTRDALRYIDPEAATKAGIKNNGERSDPGFWPHR